jgi:hypothetical protein
MTVNEIADALSVEIADLSVVQVCRYLNSIRTDLTSKMLDFSYTEININEEVEEGHTLSTESSSEEVYTEVTLPITYKVLNVYVGAYPLKLASLEDSFTFILDNNMMPYYYIEGNTLRITSNTEMTIRLRTSIAIQEIVEPFLSTYETDIPTYMKEYICYKIGSIIFSKSGDWSKQGYYKNQAREEAIRISILRSPAYTINRGGKL